MGDKFYFNGDLERAAGESSAVIGNLVERRLEDHLNRKAEMCVVSKTAVHSIATATNTALIQDVDDYDPYDWHSTTSSTHIILPGTAGWYRVSASAYAIGLVSTTRVRYQLLNVGTVVVGIETDSNVVGAWGQSISHVMHITATGYASCNFLHDRGSNIDVTARLSLELIQHD